MLKLCWIILSVPLIASAMISFLLIPLERRLSFKTSVRFLSALVSCLAIGIIFIFSCLLFFRYQTVVRYGGSIESAYTWIACQKFKIEIGVLLNGLTVLMLLIVTGVASLVAIFSSRYMQGEKGYSRYFAALTFFVFSMLGIVLANNFIQLFIFWELVGLSSYLLIGFWFEKPSAALASKKAFLTTRVGDVGMLIGILMLFSLLLNSGNGTFNFLETELYLPRIAIKGGLYGVACLFLFMGVIGKSAQVPLHVWLPDAMEGPTPASALIHAATMVAAGVFMLARLFFLFAIIPSALCIIAWVGVITAIMAASIAIVQNDIKKVLAYSTLSQLGYMVMSIGVGSPEASLFHLTTHAFFKALLFLGAGSLIHSMHTQDIWAMSKVLQTNKKSWVKSLPITGFTFLIGTAALTGLPFTSGFFSKEEILNAAAKSSRPIFYIALAVVFLTAFYMGRVITIVFFSSNKKKAALSSATSLHEDNALVTLPLIILSVLSLIAGYFPIKALLQSAVVNEIHPAPHPWLAEASMLLALAGLFFSFLIYRKRTDAAPSRITHIFEEKYFVDHFYDWLIQNIQEKIALASNAFEDHVIVRGAANGLAAITRQAGSLIRKFQNGEIQSYGLFFAIGWIALVILIVFRGAHL